MAGALENFQEWYDNFIADLEDKGVPEPNVIVPLVAVLVIAVIAAGIYVAITQSGGGLVGTHDVFVNVLDSSGSPVPSATVTLMDTSSGGAIGTKSTGSDGTVKFTGVPNDKALTAQVSHENYQPAEKTIDGTSATISLSAKELPQANIVRVSVIDSSYAPVSGANVALMAGNTPLSKTTGATGLAEFEIKGTMPTTGSVTVTKTGFADGTKTLSASSFAGAAISPIEIRLVPNEPTIEKGTVEVVLDDGTSAKPDGIRVMLINAKTTVTMDSAASAQGIATFEDVPYGTDFYVTATDAKRVYEDYESTGNYQLSRATMQVDVPLKKRTGTTTTDPTTAAKLSLLVRDSQGVPLEGAEITIFDQATNRVVDQGSLTDTYGKYEVELGSGSYYATAWLDGYLPGFIANLKNGQSSAIVLPKQTADNAAKADITVFYKGAEATGAKVTLWVKGPRSGSFLGIPAQTSGIDGHVLVTIPTKIDGRDWTLVARASKDARDAQDEAAVAGDVAINLSLRAPPAFLTASVVDKVTKANLTNAAVRVRFNATDAATCTTGLNGSCAFVVESGEEFTVTVASQGYIGFETAPMRLNPGDKRGLVLEVFKTDALSTARATFVGMYDEFGNRVSELENSQLYKAKFRFDAPQSTLAGMYVRIGREGDATKDFAYIGGFNAADSPNTTWGSLLSTTGCSEPSNQSFQRGWEDPGAKWVEYHFPRGLSASKEILVDVFVTRDAPARDNVEISYRAYAVANGVPSTNPKDDSLNALLLSKPAPVTANDFCLASENRTLVPVTSKPLKCDSNGACYRFSFIDSTGKERASGFPVEIGDLLDVNFTASHDAGVDGLSISTPYYTVLGYTLQEFEDLSGKALSAASLGNDPVAVIPVSRGPGVKARGIVHLRATKPAAKAPIDFTIEATGADDATKASKATLIGRVNGKNSFSAVTASTDAVDLNAQARVTITLKDAFARPVTDATVTLSDCDTGALEEDVAVTGDGSRGKGQDGQYQLSIKATNLGMIGVRADQNDFQPFDTCTFDSTPRLSVNAPSFVTANPESLSFTGAFSVPVSKQVTLQSSLPIAATISTEALCNGVSDALTVEPATATLQSPVTLTVTLQKPLAADCVVVINTRASPTVSQIVSIPVKANSLLPPTPTPAPYPPLDSQVTITLDEAASGQAFRRFPTEIGTVTGCSVQPSGTRPAPDGSVTVSCNTNALYVALSSYYDLSDDKLCFTPEGNTARLIVSRNVNGFPASDYVVGILLQPSPALLRLRQCIPVATATPTPTPTATPTATPTPTAVPHCTNGVIDSDETGLDCGGLDCAECGTINDCTNGVRDPGEQGIDCGGTCPAVCSGTGGTTYPALPSTINLELDNVATAEVYYSINPTGVTGCDIRSLDSSETSPTKFVAVDSQSCKSGVVRILADYSTFPLPPGLSKALDQTATLRVFKQGAAPLTATVRVTARNVPNIPASPVVCGDGVCQGTYESSTTCAKDCPLPPKCNDGVQNGDEEGVDCGGSCANACASTQLGQLPGQIQMSLNDEAFTQQSYSLAGLPTSCKVTGCEVKAGYVDSQNPSTQITNFVTVDSASCINGVVRLTASYATYPYLYKNYRGGGSLYVYCQDGTYSVRPLSVTAASVSGLPTTQPSCVDGVQNGDETGVDCGGPCAACPAPATCSDKLKNGAETGIDCGGTCPTHCTEDLYKPLPNEVRLVLNNEAFAEAYFHAKNLGGTDITCSDIVAGYSPDAEPDEAISQYVKADCSGNVVHIIAQYAGFPTVPGLSRDLVQGGTFKVIPATEPPLPGKTIRVIVSAAGVTGAPAFRTASGLASLPSSISLTVLALQQGATPQQLGPYGGVGGFGLATPNTRTFAVRFKNAPTCEVEGFVGGGTGTTGSLYNQYTGGLPTNYNSILDPVNGWPGGAYATLPEIVYPSSYPMACRVPQVLYEPWNCNLCASQYPAKDYDLQRQGQYQGASPYNQQNNFGYQTGQYLTQSTTNPFQYSNGYNQGYGLSQGNANLYTGITQQYGIVLNAPPSCLAPSVCSNPQGCALYYCRAQVAGAEYGLRMSQGSQAPVVTPDCSDPNKLTVSAQFAGMSPQSAFTTQTNIKVTETRASGRTATKTIPVNVLVLSLQDASLQQQQSSRQIMYCAGDFESQRGQKEQLIRIRDANADAYGLPKEITVKINPFTLKGQFATRVDVVSPQGKVTQLLCKSNLKLPAGGVANVKCDQGNILVAVDLSQAQDYAAAVPNLPATDGVISTGTIDYQVGALDGPKRVTTPVKVIVDDFSPAAIQLLFVRKATNPYSEANPKGDEDSEEVALTPKAEVGTPIASDEHGPLVLKATAVNGQPTSAGRALLFARTSVSNYKDIDSVSGELIVASAGIEASHTLPVFAAAVPDAIVVVLNAEGTGSKSFPMVAKGNTLQPPIDCSLESYDGTMQDKERTLTDEEMKKNVVASCNAASNGKITVTVTKLSTDANFKARAYLAMTIGDGTLWGRRSLQIPIWIRGKDAKSPSEEKKALEEAAKASAEAKAKLAAQDGSMLVRLMKAGDADVEVGLGLEDTRATENAKTQVYSGTGQITFQVKWPIKTGKDNTPVTDAAGLGEYAKTRDITVKRTDKPIAISDAIQKWVNTAKASARKWTSRDEWVSDSAETASGFPTGVAGVYLVTFKAVSWKPDGTTVSKTVSIELNVRDPGTLDITVTKNRIFLGQDTQVIVGFPQDGTDFKLVVTNPAGDTEVLLTGDGSTKPNIAYKCDTLGEYVFTASATDVTGKVLDPKSVKVTVLPNPNGPKPVEATGVQVRNDAPQAPDAKPPATPPGGTPPSVPAPGPITPGGPGAGGAGSGAGGSGGTAKTEAKENPWLKTDCFWRTACVKLKNPDSAKGNVHLQLWRDNKGIGEDFTVAIKKGDYATIINAGDLPATKLRILDTDFGAAVFRPLENKAPAGMANYCKEKDDIDCTAVRPSGTGDGPSGTGGSGGTGGAGGATPPKAATAGAEGTPFVVYMNAAGATTTKPVEKTVEINGISYNIRIVKYTSSVSFWHGAFTGRNVARNNPSVTISAYGYNGKGWVKMIDQQEIGPGGTTYGNAYLGAGKEKLIRINAQSLSKDSTQVTLRVVISAYEGIDVAPMGA